MAPEPLCLGGAMPASHGGHLQAFEDVAPDFRLYVVRTL